MGNLIQNKSFEAAPVGEFNPFSGLKSDRVEVKDSTKGDSTAPTPTESEICYLAGYLVKIPLRSCDIGKRRWVVVWFLVMLAYL